MKLVNFAHGQLLMIGAYITWAVSVWSGLNAYEAIVIAVAVVAALGVAVERLTFRRVLGGEKLNEIFISLGLIYIFENAALLFWGDQSQRITSPFSGMSLVFPAFSITYDRVIAIAVVAGICQSASAFWFTERRLVWR